MHPEGAVQAGRELEQADGFVGVRGREQVAALSRPQCRDLAQTCETLLKPSADARILLLKLGTHVERTFTSILTGITMRLPRLLCHVQRA